LNAATVQVASILSLELVDVAKVCKNFVEMAAHLKKAVEEF
jgi:hypothetical protein